MEAGGSGRHALEYGLIWHCSVHAINLVRALRNPIISVESDTPISIISVGCKTSTPLPVTPWVRNNKANWLRFSVSNHLETSISSIIAVAAFLPASFESDKNIAHTNCNATPKLGSPNSSHKHFAVIDRIYSGMIACFSDVHRMSSLYTANSDCSIQHSSASKLGSAGR